MSTILDKIFADKKSDLESTQRKHPLSSLKNAIGQQNPALNVKEVLQQPGSARIIAEIKQRSPFKGELLQDFDALKIAGLYVENGAAALSIITEERYFGGSIDFLKGARQRWRDIPLLRKDFIFAEYQVYESRSIGADMFLLIATWLEKNQLADLLSLGQEMGLTALVETHHEKDMEKAFHAQAQLIGINNRDLTSGKTDLNVARRLLKMATFDKNHILVCESGIHNREEIVEFEKLGAHAFLIGESLMTSNDIPGQLKKLLGHEQNQVPG
ncbi:MAG: indole-3-glycerol phosphate synthase TrpC [Nitrospinota bacterium]|nr:indole-3-glycerol phosphate synthase TrpC [Nitrospinota bacterium]